MNDFDYEVLVDAICTALGHAHRGECNRVAEAIKPVVEQMIIDAVDNTTSWFTHER